MNNKLMQEWIKLARKYELKRIKVADFEAEFFEKRPKRVGADKKLVMPNIPSDPEPTGDELLFWSTGTDIKAERESAEETQKQ